MISSLLDPKMGLCRCFPLKQTPSNASSCVVHYPSGTSPCHRIDHGWLLQASKSNQTVRSWAQLMDHSELVVKVVNVEDMTRVLYLRDQPKPVKHVSFDPSGTLLAVSCTDGVVYVYSMTSDQPELVKKVEGLIRTLEPEDQASSKLDWHPDGRAFAAPTATRGEQNSGFSRPLLKIQRYPGYVETRLGVAAIFYKWTHSRRDIDCLVTKWSTLGHSWLRQNSVPVGHQDAKDDKTVIGAVTELSYVD